MRSSGRHYRLLGRPETMFHFSPRLSLRASCLGVMVAPPYLYNSKNRFIATSYVRYGEGSPKIDRNIRGLTAALLTTFIAWFRHTVTLLRPLRENVLKWMLALIGALLPIIRFGSVKFKKTLPPTSTSIHSLECFPGDPEYSPLKCRNTQIST